MFKNCGTVVSRKRGKLYNRCDFDDRFFSFNNFVFRNSNDEGVCVVFPIYMYSHVKFVKLSDNCSDFCETVTVMLVKSCC